MKKGSEASGEVSLQVLFRNLRRPPSHGPRSSKEDWIAFAGDLMRVIEAQQSKIVGLEVQIEKVTAIYSIEIGKRAEEIARLKASSRPKGGRARLPEDTV